MEDIFHAVRKYRKCFANFFTIPINCDSIALIGSGLNLRLGQGLFEVVPTFHY